jgi:mannan polymerase II complex MNN10 subunit
MSLSRSPSPHPGGGWSSPGLTPGSGTSTPRSGFLSPNSLGPSGISWAAARAKSDEVRGYPSFSTRNNGFFSRSKRKITSSLPRFRMNGPARNGYVDKDEYWRAQNYSGTGLRFGFARGLMRRRRSRAILALIVLFLGYLFFWTGMLRDEILALCVNRFVDSGCLQLLSKVTGDHPLAEDASS